MTYPNGLAAKLDGQRFDALTKDEIRYLEATGNGHLVPDDYWHEAQPRGIVLHQANAVSALILFGISSTNPNSLNYVPTADRAARMSEYRRKAMEVFRVNGYPPFVKAGTFVIQCVDTPVGYWLNALTIPDASELAVPIGTSTSTTDGRRDRNTEEAIVAAEAVTDSPSWPEPGTVEQAEFGRRVVEV